MAWSPPHGAFDPSTGNHLTQLTGRKAQVDYGSYDTVLNVAASGTATITVTPPVGELWRVKLIFIEIPAPASGGAATTGTHEVEIRLSQNLWYCGVNKLKSNFGDIIQNRFNTIATASNLEIPTGDQAQIMAIQNLVVTNASPLHFVYVNNTDKTQAGTFILRIVREVEYIV